MDLMEQWKVDLNNWLRENGYTKEEMSRKTGIPASTISYYTREGKVKNLSSIEAERRRKLYELTRLERFNFEDLPENWGSQFLAPYIDSKGLMISEFAKRHHLNDATVRNWVKNDVKKLPDNTRRLLYQITELEIFRMDGDVAVEETKTANEYETPESIRESLFNYIKSRKITIAQLSRETGIPPSTLGDFLNKKSSRFKNASNFDKIKEILDRTEKPTAGEYEKKAEKTEPAVEGTLNGVYLKLDELRSEMAKYQGERKRISLLASRRATTDERIRAVNSLLCALLDELEPFKYMETKERQRLRDSFDKDDVGYLTSFLNTIYDEQKFAWILRADYKPRRRI